MPTDKNHFLDEESLKEMLRKGEWLQQNSAMLIFHGVGSQRTLETLDEFARGLIETYDEYGSIPHDEIHLSHHLAKKPTGRGGTWFDNFIRIKREGSDFHLDLYEYYWAHYSEHKVTLDTMQAWVEYTYKGAKNFYAQKKMGERYRDKSPFFDQNGCFRPLRYKFSLMAALQAIPMITRSINGALGLLRKIPIVGNFLILPMATKLRDSIYYQLCNVAGDVVVYNTRDPKFEHYSLHRKILVGAVNAIRYLVEPDNNGDGTFRLRYDRVIVAGHSLGSQISFDAINRLTHLIVQGELNGVSPDGTLIVKSGNGDRNIADILCGFVTFGSPLDKVAFFLEERAKEKAYLRAQMLSHFHSFKQKEQSLTDEKVSSPCGATPVIKKPTFALENNLLPKIFDDIAWSNYHDRDDPVSGSLDYYNKVRNIDCRFRQEKDVKLSAIYPFSHSCYWTHKPMYADIITKHLLH
jgi:hypothetical protein